MANALDEGGLHINPSRARLTIYAVFFTLYGCLNLLYYTVFSLERMGNITPSHCSGHRCNDVLSCDATRKSSWHFRVCIMILGSFVFGIKGINALYNKYGTGLYTFAFWLIACAGMYLFVFAADFLYGGLCGEAQGFAYSYNVITEGLLWPISNFPVTNGHKYQVAKLNSYPANYINALVGLEVQWVYIAATILKIGLLIFGAYEAFTLAESFQYGAIGLGANYSINEWRKRLLVRQELDQVTRNSLDMAFMTAMDVDWDRDEFQLRRPLRGGMARHWYRGVMQGQSAKAYDGFSDNRQNVLL